MLVHVFGSYFGLVVSFVLRWNNAVPEKDFAVCNSNSNSHFAVIGRFTFILKKTIQK